MRRYRKNESKGELERVLKVSGYRNRGRFYRKCLLHWCGIGESGRESGYGVEVLER